MKRLLLFFLLCLLAAGMQAQSWEELYKQSDAYWGTDWEACRDVLIQALEAAHLAFGPADSASAVVQNDLGVCYFQMEEYDLALKTLKEALVNTEKSLGKQHPDYGSRLNNLGSVYRALENYDAAIPLFQEALTVTEQSLGKNHPEYGNRLNNLGYLYQIMGHFDRAEPLYEDALAITIAHSGKEHTKYIDRLNNLGSLYMQQGRYEEALGLFQEALGVTKRILAPKHPASLTLLNNIGSLYVTLKDYEKALPVLTEAMLLTKELAGEAYEGYRILLLNVGNAYQLMGQYEQAQPLFEEALANTLQYLGPEHHFNSSCRSNLGILYDQMNTPAKAAEQFIELEKVLEFQLRTQFSTLDDRLQTAYMASKKKPFDLINSFIFRHPSQKGVMGLAYNQQLLRKGFLQHNRKEWLQKIRQDPDSAVQQSFAEWESLNHLLATEYKKPIQNRDPAFDSLQNAADQIELSLAAQSDHFHNIRKRIQWQDIQAALEVDEAAIEFAHYPIYKGGVATEKTEYVALLIRQGQSQPLMIPLFESTELESQLNASLRTNINLLYTSRGLGPRPSANNFKSLHQLIWSDLDSLLSGIQTIYFAPSGLLNRINLNSIQIDEEQLLSDRYHLVQLGSTRYLVQKNKQQQIAEKTALLLGGIEYGGSGEGDIRQDSIKSEVEWLADVSVSSRGYRENWDYLPGTAIEINLISSLLSENGYEVQNWQGLAANEAALKSTDPAPRILHIATHGYFFPDPKSNLQNRSGQTGQSIALSDHPMIRSGLILAAANQAWSGQSVPQGKEDGILTAYEISQLDLSQTELVVLSACETGLGEIAGNEGVYGLQRAFKIAGAQYILMSLWQVPDKETQELMDHFYRYWLGGMDIRLALNKAQQEIRKKYPDPWFWAGFVLVE